MTGRQNKDRKNGKFRSNPGEYKTFINTYILLVQIAQSLVKLDATAKVGAKCAVARQTKRHPLAN